MGKFLFFCVLAFKATTLYAFQDYKNWAPKKQQQKTAEHEMYDRQNQDRKDRKKMKMEDIHKVERTGLRKVQRQLPQYFCSRSSRHAQMKFIGQISDIIQRSGELEKSVNQAKGKNKYAPINTEKKNFLKYIKSFKCTMDLKSREDQDRAIKEKIDDYIKKSIPAKQAASSASDQ